MPPHEIILAWSIIILANAGVIIRPFGLPEAIWAVAGAVALVLLGLLPTADALAGMHKGVDVYLFLTGMMLIAELAQCEGLFDYLAALAVEHARGSPQRLFLLVYAVGILVTVLLSNDATAIVLTPAVYAATRAAGAAPLPYLFACAFIANAASFVLPISNPANLVVFGNNLPALVPWLRIFLLPAGAAILGTYLVLRGLFRKELQGGIPNVLEDIRLSVAGKLTVLGIITTAGVLLFCSATDKSLGIPTCLTAIAITLFIALWDRQ